MIKQGIVILMMASSLAQADIGSKVDDWFNQNNYSNVTVPGVYEGQSARYFTLGGISTRAPITRPFQLVNVQPPQFSAGCGGIDFYSGGFSAVSADQFIENLRAIGQNAPSLAFMLALSITSPQIKGAIEWVQDKADELNKFNQDSCALAGRAIGGTLSVLGVEDANCTVKRVQEYGEDWNIAKDECRKERERADTENDGSGANHAAIVKGNLTWFALMQDPFFREDLDFAELVMNIVGTVVFKPSSDGRSGGNDSIVPAIEDGVIKDRFRNIYVALMEGRDAENDIEIRRCQNRSNDPEEGCNELSPGLVIISKDFDGMHTRIRNIVNNIVRNIYDDAVLEPVEQGLISSSRIPLYRYLTASAAYFPRGSDLSSLTGDYTQLIAEDILLAQLVSIIGLVEENSANLPNGLSATNEMEGYLERLSSVQEGLGVLQRENEFDVEQFFTLQRQIRIYEQALMSRLSSGLIDSARWGQ